MMEVLTFGNHFTIVLEQNLCLEVGMRYSHNLKAIDIFVIIEIGSWETPKVND